MAKKKKALNTVQIRKIFILDTSVILHDHQAVNQFEEHDVAIPISVLEELDSFKKGNDTINFEARQFIRFVDKLSEGNSLNQWIQLSPEKPSCFTVVMQESGTEEQNAVKIFGDRKGDHLILNAALFIKQEYADRPVILVTKDVNLRLKARSLNLQSEDYETGKIQNLEGLYRGIAQLDLEESEMIDKIHQMESVHYSEVMKSEPYNNHYFIIKNHRSSTLAYFDPETKNLERVEKRHAYGIKPRNAEQTFAMHALFNNNIKLVTIQGVAGTGKTLIALAAALEQRSNFRQIYLARPIVPLNNKDIGFLPGDIKAKINPYMEPLWDNLKVIQNQYSENSKEYQKIKELVDNEKLLVTPLAYIRGRSLANIIFIVDEAQNLTPLEVKTIITRAGEGTKIIFTGDINQIDTPYLDSQSNGLSFMIDRLKGQPLYAHITLEKGERSELANLANELL
ncbi:MAG: PhoH family protein [Flavobacteriales bacterium]|nr:PhoH family protein [Flavobacteriales bacterium]